MKARGIIKQYKNNFPKVTRSREAIAFFFLTFNVAGKPAYSFAAVDQFSQYAFHLGIEMSCADADILKHIFLLTDHPEFRKTPNEFITLVMDGPAHLKESIEKIIEPGRVIFDSAYRKFISLVFMEEMKEML
ncbi:MAG: hypothetical protein WAT88_17515 [Saprospiraceae bacterium]